MKTNKIFKNRLYWTVSAVFLVFLIALAFVLVSITTYTANQYFQETNQRINASVADYILDQIQPYLHGEITETELKKKFEELMFLNPSIEVYLLDKKGNVFSSQIPEEAILMKKIPLQPIKAFVENKNETFIEDHDPKNPEICKVFSASEIKIDDELRGYIYVVLASEKYESTTQMLAKSYQMQIATRSLAVTILAAFLIGLLVIWFLTKRLNHIIETVKQFRNGDYSARTKVKLGGGDLTQLAKNFNGMADTIVANIDELKAVEKLRGELIANVSHDLRTPLATIQGYAETLIIKEDELKTKEKKHFLHHIVKGTQKLKKLVEELFELSKLETKQTKVEREAFSITELVQDNVQKYNILAQEKNIKIKTKIPTDLPLVFADLSLIDRVLQNLLDNALKFTPEKGSIEIEIKNIDKQIELQISDNGIGINQEKMPFIFQRYEKAHEITSSNEKEGIGLGLAIVKKILEIHNSAISVESKINQGTAFRFQLPVYSA